MTNAELRQLVLDKIESLGYKIKNVTHPDGYFICDYGKDSVTHFNLSGHFMSKHWKFGLWVEEKYFDPEYVKKCKEEWNMKDEDMKVIQLFAQWDSNIDKFKPSRSALCLQWDLEDINDFINNIDLNWKNESYTFNKIEDMLGFMSKHPILAYEEFCGQYAGYYNGSFLLSFIKYEWLNKWAVIKKVFNSAIWLPYTWMKIQLAKRSNIIYNLEVLNYEKLHPGFSTSYLYEVNVKFRKDVTEDEINKWLNFWWHRKNYGQYGYYAYVVEVSDITQEDCDEVWFYG